VYTGLVDCGVELKIENQKREEEMVEKETQGYYNQRSAIVYEIIH
jgi:hypothetical protein